MIMEFAKVTGEENREPVLVCHDSAVHLLFRKDELGSSISPPAFLLTARPPEKPLNAVYEAWLIFKHCFDSPPFGSMQRG